VGELTPFTNNFSRVDMHEDRFAKLNTTIKHVLRDCFEQHAASFANGDTRAIERCVLKTLKPILIDVLQLSYGDGVLACVYQKAQPKSE